ncbi:MAG: extracellular solute-binding protein [Oscillospiraceae bacterium]|nr:extracellular solute-binding protein [Oscillospiraceae bacterium]
MKKANRILTVLMFVFLYIPMIVLVVASFNTGKDITNFEGFTLQRYVELFQDDHLLSLLRNSLVISVLSTVIATTFGTVAAVGIHNLNPKMRKVVMNLTNIPMTNPDIVTGVSLSLLFVFVGSKMLGQRDALTFWTLLIAHITFNLPYVILNVMPKLQQMDSSLTNAAMDLGCTPTQAFFKVTLHEIMPGIVSGAIMAFTMSLDDFVISYFVSGLDFVPLPVEIYSYTKKPIQPKIYAMFTLLFALIFALMLAMNLMQIRSDRAKGSRRAKADSKAMRTFKRVCAGVGAFCLLLGCGYLFVSAHSQEQITLNVYNWGQYIADGSDGSMEVIKEFERRYPNIKVNYSTYDSNEIMYSKLSNGGITVDVIIPSDYMIARLIKEDMLLELDYSNIPNYRYIDENFKNTAYDPENKYSVPYTWGTVGILYNTKYVDEADVTGWELLWNEKYAGKVLMFGNSRDAFGVAQYLLGYDVNTTDKSELQAAAAKLKEQKPVLQQYVMDEIFATMQNEEAWIAPYYAGDCLVMMEENPDLAFYLPEDQGFNLFIDAMCIPTCCQEKEAAELFINFLCDPEIAGANMDWVAYGTPLSAAKDYMDPETVSDPVAYPSDEALANGTSYAYLPEDISRYMESLFMEVRNG